jgi:hypothetical protein
VIAFLKRRWVLLVALLALSFCTVVDAGTPSVGIWKGHFYLVGSRSSNTNGIWIMHLPEFGAWPVFDFGSEFSAFAMPLWMLFAVVLAWIAFRELRWREKRAKAKESN